MHGLSAQFGCIMATCAAKRASFEKRKKMLNFEIVKKVLEIKKTRGNSSLS